MRKGTRLEDVPAILGNLKRAGISTYVYVMMGVPGETAEDAERTLAFLEEHAGAIDWLNLSILNLPRDAEEAAPAPAGSAGERAGGHGEPLGLYRPVPGNAGWGRPEARRFLSRRILGSPRIREIAARTPPGFTSNHAVFFRHGEAPPG
jgi:hypothetical protein